ncbi:MAG: glycerophosphodiester phosphodiesterase family protein [Pseudorhodobacter sp.]|nr:glycerophosphodiester phosphodiesterase family protein [Pseudorhodobacter sp.]
MRRSLADPEFGTAAMTEGFRLGASMELDLRVRADGGFVVMHDDTLDRETDGSGPVDVRTADELAGVRYRQSRCPLILSEHLARLTPSAHPSALLQFDMKDDLARIGARGLDHLTDLFGSSTNPIIFSGACLDLIGALGDRLAHLPRGIDPTDRLVEIAQARGQAATEAALVGELRGGTSPDTCYLSWRLVLNAQRHGLDLVALCHSEGVKVDAWTYTLATPSRGFSEAEWAEFRAIMDLGPDQITTDEAVATEAAWVAHGAQ